jgi:hypothetical protein
MTMMLIKSLEDPMDQSALPRDGQTIASSAHPSSKTFPMCESLSQMNYNSPNQGDVTLESLFRLAYFSWPRFLADLGIAVIAGTFAYCLAVGVREVLWRKTCEQA